MALILLNPLLSAKFLSELSGLSTGRNRRSARDQTHARRPYGVETTSIERYQKPKRLGQWLERTVHLIVESDRHEWAIQCDQTKSHPTGSFDAERSETSEPWTCVNNCTPAMQRPRQEDNAVRPKAIGAAYVELAEPMAHSLKPSEL